METILNDLHSSDEIAILLELYEKLTNKSGYFFSDIYPSDIKIDVEKCLADIITIREDIEAKKDDLAQEIEF